MKSKALEITVTYLFIYLLSDIATDLNILTPNNGSDLFALIPSTPKLYIGMSIKSLSERMNHERGGP